MAVTNREQAAIRRTLRDIDEGHIGLYVTAKCFDPHTGAPIEPPEILQVDPDRMPARGIPDARGAWWEPLIKAGWLELDVRGRVHRLLLSEAGRAELEG